MSYLWESKAFDRPAARGRPAAGLANAMRRARHARAPEHDADVPMPILDAADDALLVLDSRWRIVAGSPDWLDLAWPGDDGGSVRGGDDFRRTCVRSARGGAIEAAVLVDVMRAIDGGARQVAHTYALRRTHRRLSAAVFESHGRRLRLIARTDLTELVTLRRHRARLESKLSSAERDLARIRQEERERIARDLHDSAAQCLVGVRLGLAHLRSESRDPDVIATLAGLTALIDQFQSDLRFLSASLHPPVIEQLGLHHALHALCATFTAHTDIEVAFAARRISQRGPDAVDAAIYRIVQEALSNIHKHARAGRIRVRLIERPDAAAVAVIDDGIGIERSHYAGDSAPPGSGHGIAGMASRAHELDGRVIVRNRPAGRGTIVAAMFPRRVA